MDFYNGAETILTPIKLLMSPLGVLPKIVTSNNNKEMLRSVFFFDKVFYLGTCLQMVARTNSPLMLDKFEVKNNNSHTGRLRSFIKFCPLHCYLLGNFVMKNN